MSSDDAKILAEIRATLRVLHNEAVETRRILKMLVSVISDTERTNGLVRDELHHMRTARERSERLEVARGAVGLEPEPTPT